MIALFWVLGLWLLNRARKSLPWQEKGLPEIRKVDVDSRQLTVESNEEENKALPVIWLIFSISAIATLAAGYCLEESSQSLAQHFGINNIVFGATLLAFVTTLPEITTGFASLKIGEYQLAVSDIFGGNAFLPVIFLLGVFISGKSVFPNITKADIYIASLGILLTAVYIYGLIFRSNKKLSYGI